MSLINYIKETKTEMTHVTWPTQKQAIAYTAVVIAVSLLVASLLGLFDGIYSWALEQLISIIGV